VSQLHHHGWGDGELLPHTPQPMTSTCVVNIGFHRRSFGLFLTLFSKSFSPFPRGTCVISVSGRYLALEGSHLPNSRCTPKQRYSWTVLVRSSPREGRQPHLLSCIPFCTSKHYGTVTLYGVVSCTILCLPIRISVVCACLCMQAVSYPTCRVPRKVEPRFRVGLNSCSLAATKEISVDFFSSA